MVAEAAAALQAAGVDCAPIKGALLTTILPGFRRPFSDVDLLVPARHGEAAIAALHRLGYVTGSVQPFATSLTHPDRPLPLDLHSACFATGLFRLDAAGVLTRARRDAVSFGTPVLVMHPADAYALCIGSFAKDRADGRQAARLGDLALIARTFPLAPTRLAAHLSHHGLARAADYVLGLAAERGDAFARRVRAALPPSRVGRLASHVARTLIRSLPPRTPLSAPAAHLLNATLPRGAWSLSAHLAGALPRRLGAAL
jgi:hypothetical protein